MRLGTFGRTIPLMLASVPLAAQEPDSALAERLEFVERMVEVLQAQIAEQAGGASVAPGTGVRVDLFGIVLANAFVNSGRPFMDDVPQFVLPPDTVGTSPYEGGGGATAAVRQTRLTLAAQFDDFAGGFLTTELDLDFFGGQHPSSGGRTFPTMRIRRTRAQIQWANARVMFGQDAPPIVEINPSSLAALGFPGFTGSGNLWLWLPQGRVRLHTQGTVQLGVEVAALAPSAGEKFRDPFYTEPDLAEKSRRPFVQSRVVAEWGTEDQRSEVSIGGHLGWFHGIDPVTQRDSLLRSEAAAVSGRIFLGRHLEVRGEAFTGQILRGLGGGGVYQNFGINGTPLRARGGWIQLNVLPSFEWEFGAGAGMDDPNNDDVNPLDVEARSRNISWEGHLIWRPSPLVFGFELRRMETTYAAAAVGERANNHFNLALGFEF